MSEPVKGLRVLVAEDVAVNRELIRMVLEPRGHDVQFAHDGRMAVEAARLATFDVILMDLQMPGMDGLDATRAIRALGGDFARIPIVALSANVMAEQVRQCLEAGMTTHLAKPFTTEQLCEMVERWRGGAHAAPNPVLGSLIEQVGRPSVNRLLELLRRDLAAFLAADEDGAALATRAHGLRGASAALGFEDVAIASRSVELDIRAGGADAAAKDVLVRAASAALGQIDLELAKAAA